MGMDQEESFAAARIGRDPESLEALIETHGTRLFRSAMLLCGNETTAQDLVQDTFVEAFRSLHRFRRQASLYTWLHSILLNLTRHHRRDSKRMVYDNELAMREDSASEEPSSTSDLENASTELTLALRQLSELHREVLVLRYYEHMKIAEIAR